MQHISLFGMRINHVDLQGAAEQVLRWTRQSSDTGCRFVVTPNVDHAVMYQHRTDLRSAYSDAAMVLADGAPLVAASRLLGRPLPERVAGSDLTPKVFEMAAEREGEPLRVFLLGAGPGVADRAALRIQSKWKNVKVVGTHCPPLGYENDQRENELALEAIASASPELLVVGLGAPKQELWVHRYRAQIAAPVALCAGATIDFLAGEKNRSPVWMRRSGLEWAHRLLSEPRRLAARYARDAWVFPQLFWQEWRAAH